MEVEFRIEPELPPEEFLDLLHRSGLAERRPVSDRAAIAGMLANASLIVTARLDGRDSAGGRRCPVVRQGCVRRGVHGLAAGSPAG